jgi:hypothetical protein
VVRRPLTRPLVRPFGPPGFSGRGVSSDAPTPPVATIPAAPSRPYFYPGLENIAALGADLALWFDNDQAYKSSGGGVVTPDSILTYTAPSPKLVYGADGVLGYAPHNRIAYSDDLSGATWGKTRGSATTDKFSCDSTSDNSHSIQANSAATAGIDSVFSLDLKGAEITTVFIQVGGTVIRAVNLSTGALGTYALGTSTASIVAVDDGYYRVTIRTTPSSANLLIFAGEGDGSTLDVTLAGVRTGEGFFIRRAQFSYGVTDFTYIPTTTAAVYSLPRDHNPTTLAALGVLVEEARTNLLTYSADYSNAAWSKSNITITLNNTTGPDGVPLSAAKIAATASTFTTLQQGAVVAATSATATVFVKKGSGATQANEFNLYNLTTASTLIAGTFNYDTGVWTYTTGSTGVVVTALPNGWWRISITATITSGNTIRIYPCFQENSETAGEFAYLWGAQLEAGAFATSYIPTVASQVTRAADQISILTSAFPYSATAGTMVVAADSPGISGAANIVTVDDGTTNERIRLLTDVLDPKIIVTDGGVAQANIDTGAIVALQPFAMSAAYALNDIAACLNGGTVGTDTVATIPTVTTLRVGSDSVGNHLNGHIKRLAYYNTRKDNSTLQVLST